MNFLLLTFLQANHVNIVDVKENFFTLFSNIFHEIVFYGISHDFSAWLILISSYCVSSVSCHTFLPDKVIKNSVFVEKLFIFELTKVM